jgi:hypothetical protein
MVCVLRKSQVARTVKPTFPGGGMPTGAVDREPR